MPDAAEDHLQGKQDDQNGQKRHEGRSIGCRRGIVIGILVTARIAIAHRAGTAGRATQGHAVDVGNGAGHILGTGGHGGVIVARRKAVLHGLRNGAGLLFQCGVAEAVACRQIIVTVRILLGLHHQKDEHTVVVAGAAQPPGVGGLHGVVLGGDAARVLHGQYTDLCPAALFGQLGVEVLDRRCGAVAQDIGIVHDALVAGQAGQLGLGRKGSRHQRRDADRQDQQHSAQPGSKSFHRFHAKGSTSLTPNRLFSTLAGKPPVSF